MDNEKLKERLAQTVCPLYPDGCKYGDSCKICSKMLMPYELSGQILQACKESGLKFVHKSFAVDTYQYIKRWKHEKSAHEQAFEINSQIKEIDNEPD